MRIYFENSAFYASVTHENGKYLVTSSINKSESLKWTHIVVTWDYDKAKPLGK